MDERILTTKEIKSFQRQIYRYYKLHRRDFPWRRTTNPYNILVSEIMLQQTQVERVHDKYLEFIKTFPDFEALASTSQKDVLVMWQGLGYNRRALALRKLAEDIVSQYDGMLPNDVQTLSSLPGIGKTTAGAILAFAFNIPSVFIETNIRRVFINEFFIEEEEVKDAKILPLVEATIDRKNPREWYWALMDYGSMLKREVENPNRRSAHYTRQPSFAGSDRRIRGLVIKKLLDESNLSVKVLNESIGINLDHLERILRDLINEGFIREENGFYKIA
ncbi:MAG: mutY [Deltaproteobacteria bacterium]|nr:mutY [Deltaproteobacteria bacterium]